MIQWKIKGFLIHHPLDCLGLLLQQRISTFLCRKAEIYLLAHAKKTLPYSQKCFCHCFNFSVDWRGFRSNLPHETFYNLKFRVACWLWTPLPVSDPSTAVSVWVESPKGKIKEWDSIELQCRGNGNPSSSIISFKHGEVRKATQFIPAQSADFGCVVLIRLLWLFVEGASFRSRYVGAA